ncbi:MAG: tetratricopeptide repeat protein [Deltaproteobacteria bacterium]|nr:tetratricopeptide repeat protein [Deltaproteobacteria bacterium]
MLEAEDLQLLAEVGFCGVSMGNMLQARKIFNGILLVRPGHKAPLMGLAMSHYMVDEFEQAEEILLEILKADPQFDMAKAHLALTYLLAGRKEEAKPLLEEVKHNGDSMFMAMADELLEKLV